MIRYVQGNLLEADVDALVNTVGVMGKMFVTETGELLGFT